MINKPLTSSQAAERLGVKPATLYAYVSRGLLHPERGPRGSSFDPHEIALLARTARRPEGSNAAGAARQARVDPNANDPAFVTELTLIRGGRLYYRGQDAVELSRSHSFEEVAEWLWAGEWPERTPQWRIRPAVLSRLARALEDIPESAWLVERFMVAVVAASLCDDLRHDLQPSGVPLTGRALLSTLAASLPYARRATAKRGSFAERVWSGLTRRTFDEDSERTMQAALVLGADHELAPATLAARVAAAFRADPYAVVLTGLGPASGSWRAGSTGAPSEVEGLLSEAQSVGAERAIGDRLRRTGAVPHGFGMPLYPEGDPRGRELLEKVLAHGSPERREVVAAVVEVARERGFPPPNFDMGLGALAFCAEMTLGSGQAIFTLAKVAGWLAHAVEEYTGPTRFRSRADYVGVLPGG